MNIFACRYLNFFGRRKTAVDKSILLYEAERKNTALRANLKIILLHFQSEELKKKVLQISKKP